MLEEQRRIQGCEHLKMLTAPWTYALNNTIVYQTAGTTSKLLHHVKEWKMRYFRHIFLPKHSSRNHAVMTALREGIRNIGRQVGKKHFSVEQVLWIVFTGDHER